MGTWLEDQDDLTCYHSWNICCDAIAKMVFHIGGACTFLPTILSLTLVKLLFILLATGLCLSTLHNTLSSVFCCLLESCMSITGRSWHVLCVSIVNFGMMSFKALTLNTEWAMSYLVFEVSSYWTPIPGNDRKDPPDSWLCFIWKLNERRKMEGHPLERLWGKTDMAYYLKRRHKLHQCERPTWAWHHNKCFKNGNKSSHLDPPIMSPWNIPCQGHYKLNVRKADYKVL